MIREVKVVITVGLLRNEIDPPTDEQVEQAVLESVRDALNLKDVGRLLASKNVESLLAFHKTTVTLQK